LATLDAGFDGVGAAAAADRVQSLNSRSDEDASELSGEPPLVSRVASGHRSVRSGARDV